jgi:chromosome partitioning protein
MSTVIAISNQKGGVAKTTTCVSLGAALVEQNHEVLVIDMDPQANLSLALGVNPAGLRRTVADVLLGNYTPVSVSRETVMPGLDLMPANQDMQLVEKFLYVRQDYEHTLRKALQQTSPYEVILCDCPPSLGAITVNALTAADLLLIPTQCEYFSAHGLNEVLDFVRNIRERTNAHLSYRLLITMFDRRNRVHRSIFEQIKTAFGEAVLDTTIEVDTKLRESPVFGQPITSYAPNSRAAEQYRALAEELMRHAQQKTKQPA